MPIQDLWPEEITEKTGILMPITILREQAVALTRKTKGLLEGVVVSENPEYQDGNFEHYFRIVAPALDNYTHTLFSVRHKLIAYPSVVAFDGNRPEAKDSEALVNLLKMIFNHETTKSVIQALLAQSTS